MPEASEAKVKLAAVNENPASARDLLRIVIVGHVDHGKSTLVGRMFHDTGSLPDGKYESIKAMCERRGVPFEWAFLMDALQAERDARNERFRGMAGGGVPGMSRTGGTGGGAGRGR